VDPAINILWLGLVGPGVRRGGVDATTWSDETDIRPTMLALLGLTDDYSHQGRVLAEEFTLGALPPGIAASSVGGFTSLARLYKQINAPVGQLGLDSLVISTKALASGSASDDSTFTQLESEIATITAQRDALAQQMNDVLEEAAFNNHRITDREAAPLMQQARRLLDQVHFLSKH
jgi:outer membrane murein-binding lipoprotein Lpp